MHSSPVAQMKMSDIQTSCSILLHRIEELHSSPVSSLMTFDILMTFLPQVEELLRNSSPASGLKALCIHKFIHTRRKRGCMKNSYILILLIAVLLAAGCTGQNQSPAAPVPAAGITTLTIPPTAGTTLPPAPLVTETARSTFIVTAIPTAAATAAPAGGSTKTYSNREYGFSLEIPQSWTTEGEWVNTAGGYEKKYKIYFDEPSKSALQYVTITGGASGLKLEDYYNIYLKQYQADPEISIVSQDSVEMDGTPAKKLVMIRGTGENALESILIMTIKGDNAYFFEFTTRTGQFATYLPATETVLDTLKFI